MPGLGALRIRNKIMLGSALVLVLLVPMLLYVLSVATKAASSLRTVIEHDAALLGQVKDLRALVIDMEVGQRGFLITGDDEFLVPYNDARGNLDHVLAELRTRFSGDPEALSLLERIEHHAYKWMGVAGVPEIRLRQAIRDADVHLTTLSGTIAKGKGKELFDDLRALLQQLSNRVAQTSDLQEQLLVSQLHNAALNSEVGQRGFLLAGRDTFLEPYYTGRRRFTSKIRELEQKFRSDAETKAIIQRVKEKFESWIQEAAAPEIALRVSYQKDPRELAELERLLKQRAGKTEIDKIRNLNRQLSEHLEKKITRQQAETEASVARAVKIAAVGIMAAAILSILAILITARSIVRPTELLIRGSEIIGGGDYRHRIEVTTGDELGQLTGAFNDMAGDLLASRTTLERERDYIDSVVRSMVDALMVVSPEGRIETVNAATLDLLAYAEHELIGRPFTVVVGEEGGEREEEGFLGTSMQELVEIGAFQDRRLCYQTKSGARVPMNLNGSVMRDAEGRITGVVCVARDMSQVDALIEELGTARRFSEGIVRTVPSALVALDREGRIVSTNPSFALLFKEEGLDRSFQEFLSDPDLLRSIEFSTKSRRETTQLEIQTDLPDRPGATLAVVVTSLRVAKEEEEEEEEARRQEQRARVLVVIDDITEKHRLLVEAAEAAGAARQRADELEDAYRKVREAQGQLVQASKLAAMGQLGAGIAHELNQPLTGIRGFAQSLQEKLGEEHQEALGVIVRQTTRMMQIIGHVRDFSRQTDFTVDAIPIRTSIDDALMLLNEQLRLRSIQVRVETPDDLPPVVGNSQRLEQVFLNLTTNARDALDCLEQNEKVITIEARPIGNGLLEVLFSDNGPGIPEEVRADIFNPFFTTKEPGQGTGLGLSISHGIIEQHGGSITLEESGKQGTTFVIRLPLAEPGQGQSDKGARVSLKVES